MAVLMASVWALGAALVTAPVLYGAVLELYRPSIVVTDEGIVL